MQRVGVQSESVWCSREHLSSPQTQTASLVITSLAFATWHGRVYNEEQRPLLQNKKSLEKQVIVVATATNRIRVITIMVKHHYGCHFPNSLVFRHATNLNSLLTNDNAPTPSSYENSAPPNNTHNPKSIPKPTNSPSEPTQTNSSTVHNASLSYESLTCVECVIYMSHLYLD